ncbi:hypothetical protein BKA58DRAFT_448035 [Alternaria rosae]|uniref:uncharacterized protein n=1 Tax=Alternaria rosae TaxID=1187941 RepID=UPI001E8D5CD9|nr:uncharacterized protein BKA58DRAFT_448035 [Alternaria rosae]KAH6883255.1 hypothetical protein BKA58DRAFT_448035 [Alternaria rosae]
MVMPRLVLRINACSLHMRIPRALGIIAYAAEAPDDTIQERCSERGGRLRQAVLADSYHGTRESGSVQQPRRVRRSRNMSREREIPVSSDAPPGGYRSLSRLLINPTCTVVQSTISAIIRSVAADTFAVSPTCFGRMQRWWPSGMTVHQGLGAKVRRDRRACVKASSLPEHLDSGAAAARQLPLARTRELEMSQRRASAWSLGSII